MYPDLSHTARGMRRVALAALAMLSGCSAAPGALWRTHAAMSSLDLKIPPPVVALFFALCMWLASSLVAALELPFVLRVGAALTLVAVGLVVYLSSPNYVTLYRDLDPADAGAMKTSLTTANIPVQLSRDGTAVLVPEERFAEARFDFLLVALRIGDEAVLRERPVDVRPRLLGEPRAAVR